MKPFVTPVEEWIAVACIALAITIMLSLAIAVLCGLEIA